MTTVTQYFSGQGKLFIAPVLGGVIQEKKLRWLGNVPTLQLATEIETETHKESWSGTRAKDFTLKKEKSLTINATIEEFTRDNLVLALQAIDEEIVSGSVNDEISANDLVADDVWLLKHQRISQLVLTDSTATPTVLKSGEHYRVDETFGRITINSVKGLKLPLKAAYAYEKSVSLDMLQTNSEGHYLRFEGLNTADGNKPVLVEVFKADLSPTASLDLITDELGSFELKGEALLHNAQLAKVTLL